MERFARLIIYEGEEPALIKQIHNSLPEGYHDKGFIKIMVINLSSDLMLKGIAQGLFKNNSTED